MNSKGISPVVVVASLLLVFSLAALGFGLWKYYQGRQLGRTPVTHSNEAQQLARDRKILSGSEGTPHERYGAMVRLGRIQDPLAKSEALKRVDDSQTLLREGAAQALGFFDDEESLGALKTLLQDKEKSVRLFAIQGLGSRKESLRESELLELLENENLDEDSKVAIYSSLIQAGSTEKKNMAKAELYKIALSGDATPQSEAAVRLVTLLPEEASTRDLLKKKIAAQKNERVMAVGIRHLSSLGDSWIREQLEGLANHESSTVRMAVIQSLHRVCPPNRWKILEGFAKREKDEQVLKLALEEPAFLLGSPAKNFLNSAIESQRLSEEHIKVARETLSKVEQAASDELCR